MKTVILSAGFLAAVGTLCGGSSGCSRASLTAAIPHMLVTACAHARHPRPVRQSCQSLASLDGRYWHVLVLSLGMKGRRRQARPLTRKPGQVFPTRGPAKLPARHGPEGARRGQPGGRRVGHRTRGRRHTGKMPERMAWAEPPRICVDGGARRPGPRLTLIQAPGAARSPPAPHPTPGTRWPGPHRPVTSTRPGRRPASRPGWRACRARWAPRCSP